jgi:hypothetical protein
MLGDENGQGDKHCQHEQQYGGLGRTAPRRKVPRVVGARHQLKNAGLGTIVHAAPPDDPERFETLRPGDYVKSIAPPATALHC